MSDLKNGLQVFAKLQAHFHALVDVDPVRAVNEARALPDTPVDGVFFTVLKGGILIDAGSCARDLQAIRDGIEIFRGLLKAAPDSAVLHYNLGNGLVALADQIPYSDVRWYLATAEERRAARTEFQRAAVLDNDSGVASTALTNLGNGLWNAHRWVEAYDAYIAALAHDATNGVAATGAAKVLLRCVDRHIGERGVLLAVAARHLQQAREHPHRIAELAGHRASADLGALLSREVRSGEAPDMSDASEYEKFVARYRLALSPTIEGLERSLKRWDSLRIESLIEPTSTPHGVPALFAMFNVVKADFLAARLLAYEALETTIPDTGSYADTLDYALYGLNSSVLLLAQRACVDVLDKIAVATSEYFGISGAQRAVSFLERWFQRRNSAQPPAWYPTFAQAAQDGNTAVVALAEMSLDIGKGGALSAKRELRHSATHRFTVLHDLGSQPSRQSSAVEHFALDDFSAQLIESLQLARAALLYFVEMVTLEEHKKDKQHAGLKVPLAVPNHHWIRGEDEEIGE